MENHVLIILEDEFDFNSINIEIYNDIWIRNSEFNKLHINKIIKNNQIHKEYLTFFYDKISFTLQERFEYIIDTVIDHNLNWDYIDIIGSNIRCYSEMDTKIRFKASCFQKSNGIRLAKI